MGYTNKTSHYELPQYVANDKPSWLGDFNAAMLKIDTVLADNDATAEAANSAATGAQTQVAALSSQLSTIQGQVNTAVDTATTAEGKATTAQTVATQANTTAGEAKTLAQNAKNTADGAVEVAGNAVPKSGGSMTGPLILNGNPTEDNGAATKAYVDEMAGGAGGALFICGDGFTDEKITRATGYSFGSKAVNVDLTKYGVRVKFIGCVGVDGASGATSVRCRITTDTGTTDIECTNTTAQPTASSADFLETVIETLYGTTERRIKTINYSANEITVKSSVTKSTATTATNIAVTARAASTVCGKVVVELIPIG